MGSGGSGGVVGDEGPRFLSSRYVLSMRLIFIPQVTLSTFGGQDGSVSGYFPEQLTRKGGNVSKC